MSVRTISWLSAGVLAAFILVLLSAGGFEPRGLPLELRIVARGMAFRVEGYPGENPEIRLPEKANVVLHFSNEDPGINHELSLPSLGLQTGILATGEVDRLTFRSSESGTLEYRCALHPGMMRGTIRFGN